MSEIAYTPNKGLPMPPEADANRTERILEAASAEVILADGEPVQILPGENKGRRGVYVMRNGEQPVFHARRLNLSGVFVDRGDGEWMITPADRASCIERQYGQGINELLLRIRLGDDITESPPVPRGGLTEGHLELYRLLSEGLTPEEIALIARRLIEESRDKTPSPHNGSRNNLENF